MEYNIDEIISSLDFKSSKLNNLSNGLVLTNNEIDVLNKYNIKYKSCSSLKEVLMLIDEKFNYEECKEYLAKLREDRRECVRKGYISCEEDVKKQLLEQNQE